jgi:hypothetical protein
VRKLEIGIAMICLVVFIVIIAVSSTTPSQSTAPVAATTAPLPQPETPFDQMTPAQHLEKARSFLQGGMLSLSQDQAKEVDRQFAAIPKSTPEWTEAKLLQKQVTEAAKAQYLKREREVYASKLQAQLESQGFDITVTQFEDELIVSSDLFKDDAGRIQFLSSIRSNRKGFCNMGFRRAALSASGMFAGTYRYSLGCK